MKSIIRIIIVGVAVTLLFVTSMQLYKYTLDQSRDFNYDIFDLLESEDYRLVQARME